MTKIKICGLRRSEDIAYVNEARPDYCGFVIDVPFSSRSISPEELSRLREGLDDSIHPVGVFVNAPPELVAGLLKEGMIRTAQLHGQEDERYLAAVRALCGSRRVPSETKPACHASPPGPTPVPELWKSFSILGRTDLMRAQESSADMVLLDRGRGGTGRSFDWNLLDDPPPDTFSRPYILAGGLSPANIPEVIRRYRPWAIDLSSSVETDGHKDLSKIKAAMAAVRSVEL